MEDSSKADVLSSSSIRPTLEEALRCLIAEENGASELSSVLCQKLLLEEPLDAKIADSIEHSTPQEPGEKGDEPPDPTGQHLVKGYPHYPLSVRLSDCLWHWMVHKQCPSLSLPAMFMLNEEAIMDERKKKLERVGRSVEELYSQWKKLLKQERLHRMAEILKLLDLRGILDVLGLRCTVGSCPLLPPPRHALLASFTRQHHPQAKLSVGGRALSKHCHRDNTHQWWGKCTGSEAMKNEHALEVALRILNSAVWINIHTLPHDVQVLEVRTEEGYGLRWLSDGSEFRGFLEPQMLDGHAVSWRH